MLLVGISLVGWLVSRVGLEHCLFWSCLVLCLVFVLVLCGIIWSKLVCRFLLLDLSYQ